MRAASIAMLVATVTASCIGRESHNDDEVDSTSPRPSSREHTLAPPDLMSTGDGHHLANLAT
jgi:hypothetical protein